MVDNATMILEGVAAMSNTTPITERQSAGTPREGNAVESQQESETGRCPATPCSACFSRDREGVWVKIMVNGVGRHVLLDSHDEEAIMSIIQNTHGNLAEYTVGDYHWSPGPKPNPINKGEVNGDGRIANEIHLGTTGKCDSEFGGLGDAPFRDVAGGETFEGHKDHGLGFDVNVVSESDKPGATHDGIGSDSGAERQSAGTPREGNAVEPQQESETGRCPDTPCSAAFEVSEDALKALKDAIPHLVIDVAGVGFPRAQILESKGIKLRAIRRHPDGRWDEVP